MNYIIIGTLTSHNLYRESASWKPCGTSEGPSRTWTRRGSSGWRPRGRYGGGPGCIAGSARARGGWWWPGRRPPSPPARCWWQTSCSAWSNQCQTVSIFVKLDVQCPMSDVQYTLEIFHFITTSPTPSLHPSKSDSNDIMSSCHHVIIHGSTTNCAMLIFSDLVSTSMMRLLKMRVMNMSWGKM